MKKVLEGMIVVAFVSGICLAETWTGKLVDATCANEQNTKADRVCTVNESTESFAIRTADGKIYKLDLAANVKAADTLKANKKRSDMDVTVIGTMSGDTVKVDTINAQ